MEIVNNETNNSIFRQYGFGQNGVDCTSKEFALKINQPTFIDQIYMSAVQPNNWLATLIEIKEVIECDWIDVIMLCRLTNQIIANCEIGNKSNNPNSKINRHFGVSYCGKTNIILSIQGGKKLEEIEPHLTHAASLAEVILRQSVKQNEAESIIRKLGRAMGTINFSTRQFVLNKNAKALLGNERSKAFWGSDVWFKACETAKIKKTAALDFQTHNGHFSAEIIFSSNQGQSLEEGLFIVRFHRVEIDGIKKQQTSVFPKLTRAEAAILKMIFDGKSADDISNLRRSKRETVRAQLRSLREKTSTKSMLALAQLRHKFNCGFGDENK